MDRLTPKPRSQLSPDQKKTYDTLQEMTAPFNNAFLAQRPLDSAFIGPFPCFLTHPNLGQSLAPFVTELGKMPGLPADARETAILAVGAVYKAGYELYAHGNVAIKIVGMSDSAVKSIIMGKKPDGDGGLNEKCSVAYDVATALAASPGPLGSGLWEESVRVLGTEGTVALVHYVGFYAYTCVMLNAIDASVPEDKESKVKWMIS